MTQPMATPVPDPLHPTVRAYVRNPEIARTYDTYFADNRLFQYDCTFLDEHLRPPGRILDAGCGTGRHLVYLRRQGFAPVGLDLNPHMLAEARANLAASACEARLVCADFHHLPFAPTPRFDGILLMFSTLGLVQASERRREILTNLCHLLAPGGVLIAHVHNHLYRAVASPLESLRRSLQQWAGLSEEGDTVMRNYRGIQDLFLHAFTEPEIRHLMAASGLRVRELRHLNAKRDGPYLGPDACHNANGFLVAATP